MTLIDVDGLCAVAVTEFSDIVLDAFPLDLNSLRIVIHTTVQGKKNHLRQSACLLYSLPTGFPAFHPATAAGKKGKFLPD